MRTSGSAEDREHRTDAAGAIAAQGRVGLMLNVRKKIWPVLAVLPALKRPTISELAADNGEQWVAVNTIIEETTARDVIPAPESRQGAGHR